MNSEYLRIYHKSSAIYNQSHFLLSTVVQAGTAASMLLHRIVVLTSFTSCWEENAFGIFTEDFWGELYFSMLHLNTADQRTVE